MKHMLIVCFLLFGGGGMGGGGDEWALCFTHFIGQIQYATVLNTIMDTYSN